MLVPRLSHRMVVFLLLAAGVIAPAACGGGGAAGSSGGPPAARTCPAAWAAGWQAWANTVQMTVYCPSFLPTPLTGEIGGQWNTAKQPGRTWQLGYAWLEHGDLVHVVFEGYPAGAWPVDCEGVPCFAHIVGHQRIGPFQVTWYDHNQASHTGHIAAVFRANGNVYVVSMHIAVPAAPESKTKALVTRMVAGLVRVTPTV